MIKATGTLAQAFSREAGVVLLGTLVVPYWVEGTCLHLTPHPGTFVLHRAQQEHWCVLVNGIDVREESFVLNGPSDDGMPVDPPVGYYAMELRDDTDKETCTCDVCLLSPARRHSARRGSTL